MIFIPGNVPSVKNTKTYTNKGVFHSKTVRKYLQKIGIKNYRPTEKKDKKTGVITPKLEEYKTRPNFFRLSVQNYFDGIKYPAIVGFHFVRGTRHKADFHNLVQIVADLLTAHDFIEDDNMTYITPVPMFINGQVFTYSKENPGVYVKILSKAKAQELTKLLGFNQENKAKQESLF